MFGKKETEKKKEQPGEQKALLTQADRIKQTTEAITSKHEHLMDGYTEEEIKQLTGTTGTENMQASRRLPMITWNLDMRDEEGRDIRPDMFYNCMNGEVCKSLSLALLMADGRCREKAVYDEQTHQKTVMCKTTDGQVGIEQSTGNMKDCEICPDKTAKKGSRRPCTPVINMIAYDLERNQPVVLRAMRSNYVPFANYIERYHFKQLLINGNRVDLPLYMLWMELTLKEESGHGKRYYVACPKCMGPIADKQTVMALMNMADRLKNMKNLETEEPENAKYSQQDVGSKKVEEENDDIPY